MPDGTPMAGARTHTAPGPNINHRPQLTQPVSRATAQAAERGDNNEWFVPAPSRSAGRVVPKVLGDAATGAMFGGIFLGAPYSVIGLYGADHLLTRTPLRRLAIGAAIGAALGAFVSFSVAQEEGIQVPRVLDGGGSKESAAAHQYKQFFDLNPDLGDQFATTYGVSEASTQHAVVDRLMTKFAPDGGDSIAVNPRAVSASDEAQWDVRAEPEDHTIDRAELTGIIARNTHAVGDGTSVLIPNADGTKSGVANLVVQNVVTRDEELELTDMLQRWTSDSTGASHGN